MRKMVAGIFHKGSGLGNQLHRYVATRVLALDKDYDFSMVAPENFKGKSFMNLDMGIKFESFSADIPHATEMPSGKVIPNSEMPRWEEKTPYYNPEFNFIEDNTIIDGEFQDERYFENKLAEADSWLKTKPIYMPDDVCVIGFRGGEFYTVPELGLPKSYYYEAIDEMLKIVPDMMFEVHTDDEALAKQFFPNFPVVHNISLNWRSVRYAKYAIVANSSFYILPRLIAHNKFIGDAILTIAPRYWDRYNIKKWERPYNYYKAFIYI